MEREDREIFRAAEADVARVLRLYVHVRMLLGHDRVGAIDPSDDFRAIGFTSRSVARDWKMDVEKSAMRVDRRLGLRGAKLVAGTWHAEALQLMGDWLVVGLRGGRLAEIHHSTPESVTDRYERCIANMWIEFLSRDITDDYRQLPEQDLAPAPAPRSAASEIAADAA